MHFTFEPNVISSDLLKATDTITATTMIEVVDRAIRVVPDFPQSGVQYRDLTTIWMNHQAFKASVSAMELLAKKARFNKIVGVETYSWVYAAILAGRLGKPFIPIRRSEMLPAETVEVKYGQNDRLYIHEDALGQDDRLLLVKDFITTGESTRAACTCVERLGAKVEKIIALIDLADKGGKNKLTNQGYEVATMLTYSDK